MDAEFIRGYCLKKKYAEESFPFGYDTLVFKVKGKMFLLMSLHSTPLQFNVKCDPEQAVELREQYEAIQPGYHMNKRLWITVIINGNLSQPLIKKLIDDSYLLIIKSLPKKIQKGLI